MLDSVLDVFNVKPDVDLNLMRERQTLARLTAMAVQATSEYLEKSRSDAVVIQGDTTTVLVAALAAYYQHIRIVHVEAGLRTGNLHSPWPEEGNRILTGHLPDIHCGPTEVSRGNLLREGIPFEKIHATENTVIDALMPAQEKICRNPPVVPEVPQELLSGEDSDQKLILITGHRRENFGRGTGDFLR